MKISSFVVNLSRLSNTASGLNSFSKAILNSLDQLNISYDLLTTKNYNLSSVNFAKSFVVPNLISSTKKTSLIRPILWLIYSYFLFPCRNNHIITTTHHIVPNVKNQIITVHDLRPYFYPESILQSIYFRYLLPRNIRSIDGVFTVSNATKNELIKIYKVDPNKICILTNSINTNLFSPSIHPRNTDTHPYLLVVGGTWYFKNVHEILHHSDLWCHKYSLKVVSSPNSYQRSLIDICTENDILSKVEFINNVNDEALVNLYRNASALIYPSLIEGFGIPPLEAMACGTPAIVSSIPVFQEIYGKSAIFVELGNRDSWANAISKLDDKIFLEQLKSKGIETSNHYNQALMNISLKNGIKKIWPELVKFY